MNNQITGINDQDDVFHYGTMTKTQLALLYFPAMEPVSARRKLNTWIVYNKSLWNELINLGYCSKQILLTPAQVRVIVKYLGEP